MKGLVLLLIGATVALLAACTTVEAPATDTAPFPFEIQVLTPTPPSQALECQVALCCFDCPALPVARVIDGDTFIVGRRTDGEEIRIRLYGVDTPERGEPCFEEATERFRELAGDSVRIENGPRESDRYGRLLAYVYTADGESIAEKLIQEGLGEAWRQDGQHRDVLVGLEEAARRDGVECSRSQVFPNSTRAECHPAYPDVCIPSPPPDLDCGEIPHQRFKVLAPDPHGFDRDKDGVGCES